MALSLCRLCLSRHVPQGQICFACENLKASGVGVLIPESHGYTLVDGRTGRTSYGVQVVDVVPVDTSSDGETDNG